MDLDKIIFIESNSEEMEVKDIASVIDEDYKKVYNYLYQSGLRYIGRHGLRVGIEKAKEGCFDYNNFNYWWAD